MKPVEVIGVRVEAPGNQPVVLVRELDGARVLPIWVGAAEAAAIAYVQQDVTPPRPLTHDLFVTVIGTLGHGLDEIRITSLDDGVYRAEIVFDGATIIDARPSDAIALALRVGCPVLAEEALFDEVGMVLPGDADEGTEDEVEAFKEFLDSVSADDFDAPGEGGDGPSTEA